MGRQALCSCQQVTKCPAWGARMTNHRCHSLPLDPPPIRVADRGLPSFPSRFWARSKHADLGLQGGPAVPRQRGRWSQRCGCCGVSAKHMASSLLVTCGASVPCFDDVATSLLVTQHTFTASRQIRPLSSRFSLPNHPNQAKKGRPTHDTRMPLTGTCCEASISARIS